MSYLPHILILLAVAAALYGAYCWGFVEGLRRADDIITDLEFKLSMMSADRGDSRSVVFRGPGNLTGKRDA